MGWWFSCFCLVRHIGVYPEPFVLIPSLFCTFPLPYTASSRASPIVLSLGSPFVFLSNILTILFAYLRNCGNPYGLWSIFLACMRPGSGRCIASSIDLIGPCRYHKAVVVYVLWSFSWGVRKEVVLLLKTTAQAEGFPSTAPRVLYF